LRGRLSPPYEKRMLLRVYSKEAWHLALAVRGRGREASGSTETAHFERPEFGWARAGRKVREFVTTNVERKGRSINQSPNDSITQ
jgi:hypothetical protein